jgi:hypothetical protein
MANLDPYDCSPAVCPDLTKVRQHFVFDTTA